MYVCVNLELLTVTVQFVKSFSSKTVNKIIRNFGKFNLYLPGWEKPVSKLDVVEKRET